MSQSHEATTFAEIQDELNEKIAEIRQTPDKIRGLLQRERTLLVNLHNAWIREGRGFEAHGSLGYEFADAVIGDGSKEARVKIFAAVLSLKTDPTTQIWKCFLSALALADPDARHNDFRDECIPDFDLEYIEKISRQRICFSLRNPALRLFPSGLCQYIR